MIYYLTDNEVSHAVGRPFEKGGAEVKHIRDFARVLSEGSIFYGILRGSGSAMKICQHTRSPFYYVDNGYFDAVYMDQSKRKEMTGKYRIVKNGLVDVFAGTPFKSEISQKRPSLKVLALPPSPYSAFMHDTTPEDWFFELKKIRKETVDHIDVRQKDEAKPLADHLKDYDAVFAFNSMAAMEAIKLGKIVYTKHGILNNWDKIRTHIEHYDYDELCHFYSKKQFTLDEIAEGQWK